MKAPRARYRRQQAQLYSWTAEVLAGPWRLLAFGVMHGLLGSVSSVAVVLALFGSLSESDLFAGAWFDVVTVVPVLALSWSLMILGLLALLAAMAHDWSCGQLRASGQLAASSRLALRKRAEWDGRSRRMSRTVGLSFGLSCLLVAIIAVAVLRVGGFELLAWRVIVGVSGAALISGFAAVAFCDGTQCLLSDPVRTRLLDRTR